MAHEIETAFFGGQGAWHGLGTVIEEDVIEAARAIELAGLDWQVEVWPLVAYPPSEQDPDGVDVGVNVAEGFASVRTSDRKILGVVGPSWTPIQNREMFDLGESLVDSSEAKWHTAGSLRGGSRVWALMKLPKDVKIAGMEDEKIDPFVCLTMGHDGGMALRAIVTPVRVVCMNTLSLALSTADRMHVVRHTPNAEGRMQEARDVLGISFKYFDAIEELGNTLVGRKMTRTSMETFLTRLVPLAPTVSLDSQKAKNVETAREAIRSIAADADNLGNVRGTEWAALQAVIEYDDYGRRVRGDEQKQAETRFERAMFKPVLKNRALRILAPEFADKRATVEVEDVEELVA